MVNVRQAKRLVTIFTGVILAEMMYNVFLSNDSFSPDERSLSTSNQIIENHKSEAPGGQTKDSMDLQPVEIIEEESCRRKCPLGRINRISYWGDTGGLGDRQYVIRELAELAGYLCAQVIFPKPAQIMTRLHNNWQRLDIRIEWSDFFNLTFADDNMPAVRSDEFGNIPADYERVESQNGNWKKQFEEIQERSWRQRDGDKGIAWDISGGRFFENDLTYYELPRLPDDLRDILGSQYNPEVMAPKVSKLKKKGALCQYTNSNALPDKVEVMKTRLSEKIREMSPEDSVLGIMHLRRGDAINECDTSVAKVKEMLSCSLKGTENEGNITILLQSDEENIEYRQNIINLQNDFEHVKILDMDYLAKEVIKEAVASGDLHWMFNNNYYIFKVGSWVKGVKFTLARRRMDCNDCNTLVNVLKEEEPDYQRRYMLAMRSRF